MHSDFLKKEITNTFWTINVLHCFTTKSTFHQRVIKTATGTGDDDKRDRTELTDGWFSRNFTTANRVTFTDGAPRQIDRGVKAGVVQGRARSFATILASLFKAAVRVVAF